MKSERVAVGEVDARVSTINELKLKLNPGGTTPFGGKKSRFRSTPASKNSPAWTKLAAFPLAEDLNGQATAGACPDAPSRAVVFTIAVPMLEAIVVPTAGSPLFQVKEVIVADPLPKSATSRRSPFTC